MVVNEKPALDPQLSALPKVESKKGKANWPARFSLAILCATGVMEAYMTRINLSIAIVAMVQTVSWHSDADLVPREPFCLRGAEVQVVINMSEVATSWNGSEYKAIEIDKLPVVPKSVPPIKMTTMERGNVLSSFYYGFWATGILGGRLAELYGTKLVFGIAILVDGLGNLLIPVASKAYPSMLIFIRFIMGLFQGMCYPSINALIVRWIPPSESSRFLSFVLTAGSISSVFTLALCGLIISKLGWEWVFYISSSISFVWLLFWAYLMHDSPEDHPQISHEEKQYIQEAKKVANRSSQTQAQSIPWKEMLLCRPLWAIAVGHAGTMFGLTFFVTQLPIYLSSIIGVELESNGLFSALPFVGRFIGSNVFSWVSSILMQKVSWQPKTWKIILSVFGFAGPGLAVVLIGYAGCNLSAVLILFALAFAMGGANMSGYIVNVVEIAPSFAGTAYGMCATIAFLYAMIVPLLVGAVTSEETLTQWLRVFWICLANFMIGGGVYCFFLSTDVQPWNHTADEGKCEKGTSVTDARKNLSADESKYVKGTSFIVIKRT